MVACLLPKPRQLLGVSAATDSEVACVDASSCAFASDSFSTCFPSFFCSPLLRHASRHLTYAASLTASLSAIHDPTKLSITTLTRPTTKLPSSPTWQPCRSSPTCSIRSLRVRQCDRLPSIRRLHTLTAATSPSPALLRPLRLQQQRLLHYRRQRRLSRRHRPPFHPTPTRSNLTFRLRPLPLPFRILHQRTPTRHRRRTSCLRAHRTDMRTRIVIPLQAIILRP